MFEAYLTLMVFGVVSVGFAVVSLIGAWLLLPRVPDPIKATTYECGVEAVGSTEIKTNFRFYVVALLFVIFDVEALFVIPWAVSAKTMNIGFVVGEMMVFLAVLFAGLLYAWKKGALVWD